jgi:hypothetical protein
MAGAQNGESKNGKAPLHRLDRAEDAGNMRESQGSSPHAAPRLRLRPRQQGHDTRAIQGWLGHRSITGTATTPRWWRHHI